MYFGNLSEELLLMVLDGNTGKINKRDNLLNHGFVGGILLDLILQGRLTIHEDKIIIVDETLTGDDLLDIFFERISLEAEPLTIYTWVRLLRTEFRNIKEMILDNLIENGVLTKKIQKTFGIFKSDRYFFLNPKTKDLIINNIRMNACEDLI